MKFSENQIGASVNLIQIEEWSAAGIFNGFGDSSLNVPDVSDKAPLKKLGSGSEILLLKQEHGKKVVRITDPIDPADLKQMIDNPPTADAWIARSEILSANKIVCGIRTADCFPVLIRSRTSGLVAAVHCGWRGAQTGLLLDVITQLARLGAAKKELEIAIGPGAQENAYEVQSDVSQKLNDAFEFVSFPTATGVPYVVVERDGKKFGAITNLLVAQTIFSGVPRDNILLHPDCTISNERYFSFRRQKDQAGRQLSFIGPGA